MIGEVCDISGYVECMTYVEYGLGIIWWRGFCRVVVAIMWG